MTEDPNKTAAAPAAANQGAPTPTNPTISREAQKTDINSVGKGDDSMTAEAERAAREGRAPGFQQAAGAAPTPKHPGRSGLVTNPTPAPDPDAPRAPVDNAPDALPQATINEMEAGKKALERNRPIRREDRDESGRKD